MRRAVMVSVRSIAGGHSTDVERHPRPMDDRETRALAGAAIRSANL